VRFLFRGVSPKAPDLVPDRLQASKTAEILRRAASALEDLPRSSDAELEARFRALAAELGVKLGELLMPVRVAVTGSRVSPPLFESLRLLGTEEVQRRLRAAVQLLS